MIGKKTKIWTQEEYEYLSFSEEIPDIISYIHEDELIRPAMLVVPGGAYRMVSDSEGDIVARDFYQEGYNVFLLTYSVNPEDHPLKQQPLKDISRAVRLIRYFAEKCHVDPGKIAVCGFSAGGHLCASLGIYYKKIQDPVKKLNEISNRPDAMILAYPVITAGVKRNAESFLALLGEKPEQKALNEMSLEKHVTKDMPPCFVWQTAEDETVPVENSYLFVEACRKAGVKVAHHVFMEGVHGMSIATEEWFEQKLQQRPDKWTEQEQVHIRRALKEVSSWRMLARNWLDRVIDAGDIHEADDERFNYQKWRSGLYQ